jgi:biopolymer transport protein ExbD
MRASKYKKKRRLERLNLIPILDAVFIFIFFLLMSAQFVDIYQIGSDAPAVKTALPEKSKEDPFVLVLEIKRNQLIVKQGVDERVVKIIKRTRNAESDLKELSELLVTIKEQHPKEDAIILRPLSSIAYSAIVKIMDTVRLLPVEDPAHKANKLFERVIFETVI